ncbi:acetyl-CoA hydrolase/transferase C-terminal domain-containing protein [Haladaptatus sp. AB643]|uniref:acetyl-CoA hydrolase/transferase C-terminal domain-containing protein n=1 Tax=Haladaptatus sp. AB643 TaxID=2934174 RepID=UPI00209C4B73|nr:acetyl-CoA hydrolase/transferase C-terminal domain-containing protein [Haladaptatus sp. AB643]MCO8245396.1 acetyl-CoA hydrolase [Haladaptatus sp. AB643]
MTRAFDDDERLLGDLPTRSATAAAGEIEDDDTMLVSGFGSVGNPKAVPEALAASDRDLALTVVSGGSTGDQIDTDMVEADAIARRIPYQARPEARRAVNDRRIAFHDTHISRLGDQAALGEFGNPDVAVVEAVAVGEDWLVPSTSIGHTPAYVDAADRLVVEVNRAQPTALAALHDVYRPGLPPRGPIPLDGPGDRIGDSRIRFDPSKLVAVVETDDPDTPYSFRDPTDEDEAIAVNLVDFLTAELDRNPALEEAIRLQFGVGSMGNALMGALESFDAGNRRLDYFGEVFQDGLLDLVRDGTFDAASATSLALSEDGQQQLFDDIEGYTERLVLRPADVSNRAELIDRFGVVGVNSALEVDIYGNANSTHVGGTRLINGLGGSGDFNRNGLLSITALPSTAGRGDISRIVPMVPHVDHTEHDVSVIVTEHGVADLRGLSPVERAGTVIDDCADPDFRPRLREYVDRAERQRGHLPHDFDVAFDWFDE